MKTFLRKNCDVAIYSGAGTVFVLYLTIRFGVGFSFDSGIYALVAKNVAAGNGYVVGERVLYTLWPPLFPTILAVFEWVDIDLVNACRAVNSLSHGVIICVSLLWLKRFSDVPVVIHFAGAAILLATPLSAMYVMAWTEPLFIALTMIGLLLLDSFLATGSKRFLVAVAVVAGLAWLQRYIGAAFIATVMIAVAVQPGSKFGRRLWHVFLFWAAAIFPMLIWFRRNIILTGDMMGPRQQLPPKYDLPTAITVMWDTFTGWLFSPEPALSHRTVAAGTIGVVLVGGFVVLAFKRRLTMTREECFRVGPLVAYFWLYVGFLAYAGTTTSLDTPGGRYLAPVYVPMVLVFAWMVHHYLVALPSWRATPVRQCVVGAGLSLCLLYSAHVQWNAVNDGLDFGNVEFLQQYDGSGAEIVPFSTRP